MKEQDLIKQLSCLQAIEPRKDWVLLVKNKIFADYEPITADASAQKGINWIGQISGVGQLFETFTFVLRKPAFAVAGFILVISLGILVQINQSQQNLVQEAMNNVVVAQKHLSALQKMAQDKDPAALSAALHEFQKTSAELSKKVPELAGKNTEKALQAGIGIVQLQKSAQELERVLGVSVGQATTTQLENALKTLIANELRDLSNRSLNEEQKELLGQAQRAFDNEEYENALQMIWEISNDGGGH